MLEVEKSFYNALYILAWLVSWSKVHYNYLVFQSFDWAYLMKVVPMNYLVFQSFDWRYLILVDNYFIWSMIQRGSDTSFTNLWSLLLFIQSLLHYIENAQENKKNTILSYNIAENSKRVKWNEEKVCVCVCLDAGWCLVSTLND